MRQFHRFLFLSALLILIGSAPFAAPPTAINTVVDTLHGEPVPDPYRWLEDQNSPETREWITRQNAYTDSILAGIPGQEELIAELERLRKIARTNLPQIRGGRFVFTRRLANEDFPSLYLRSGRNGADSLILDPPSIGSTDGMSLAEFKLSLSGRYLSYALRKGGEDEVTWRIIDLSTGKHLADTLPRARYTSYDLAEKTGKLFYSTFHPDTGSIVYRHALGSARATDTVVASSPVSSGKFASCELSFDEEYLFMYQFEGSSSEQIELYAKPARDNTPFTLLTAGIKATFTGISSGNRLFLSTNWDAPNGRVFRVDLTRPDTANWKEIIPERDSPLESIALAGGRILASYLHNVHTKLAEFTYDGRELPSTIVLPSLGTISGVVTNGPDDPLIAYTFESFHLPPTSTIVNLEGGESNIWYQGPVAVNPDSVVVDQVWYYSRDDEKIPMFLVYKKGMVRDSSRPTLLYGYGGFSVSMKPGYSTTVALWIQKGGVYAAPSLRGGGEFGEKWHRAATFEKKQTTFDDFIAAGEWLIKNGYTNPGKLAISGGSNGGLLVGAAMLQRPDLFGAVVCSYPLLDMLRFHKLLVGAFWVSEYGSADSAHQFPYLRGYSPYHNIKAGGDYPATLFVTGDADTRVAPAHARKMTAALQANQGGTAPIMLLYDIEAGHAGGQAVSKSIKIQARQLAFLFSSLGME